MKFVPLYETAAASGLYALATVTIEADSTSDAVAQAAKSAPAGCRTGVWPYKMISGVPDAMPATADENGKQYNVLAQPDGASGSFAPNGQVFGSFGVDAAGMCLSLERFFNYRLGLIPTDAKPAPLSSSTTSGSPTSGTVSSGAAPVTSGGTFSSGGSATPAG
ncbi:hypothetical protein [Acetobacter indonesiensis]|uniref:hypothetical protein n=1 Tax=Acetobacter indonesiensis TaxID=104101 RepID=UPI0020A5F4BA|nr:hypothetical protein [Acetobacter indonesiensis]MCP1231723.1 hypothetical protein [Acetobacter indonesiensis]